MPVKLCRAIQQILDTQINVGNGEMEIYIEKVEEGPISNPTGGPFYDRFTGARIRVPGERTSNGTVYLNQRTKSDKGKKKKSMVW